MDGPQHLLATRKDDMNKVQMNELLIEAMMHLEMASTEGLDAQEINELVCKAHEKVQSCWMILTHLEPAQ